MRRLAILASFAILAVGCDSGPSGPGELDATLLTPGPVIGAAVLEVVGSGIEGFTGAGATRVFWARQDNPVQYRVVVVSEGGGDLKFSVVMKDLAVRTPRYTVVSMVDLENRPLSVTGEYRLRFNQ